MYALLVILSLVVVIALLLYATYIVLDHAQKKEAKMLQERSMVTKNPESAVPVHNERVTFQM